MGKEMEGDNERRRALARRARDEGRHASAAGVSLGASKQPEHVTHRRREGPPPAGGHKPDPGAAEPPPRSVPEPQWPATPLEQWRNESDEGAGPRLRYRKLVGEIGRVAGVGFDTARESARAVVAQLTRVLGEGDRRRLLDALPAELREPAVRDHPPTDVGSFLAGVTDLSGMPPEQARYRTQAVIAVLRDQAPSLADALALPPTLRELTVPPPIGGGVVGPHGHLPPLGDEELRDALRGLPYWSGDRHGLRREVSLPPAAVDRVLPRLSELRGRLGRCPHVARPAPGSIALLVRTSRVDAVTRLDVDLAHAVDDAIDAAGAGMSG
jgi:uncharacterized protein (DUF2267 family)/pterin-4a-carbinolamine dehydratase